MNTTTEEQTRRWSMPARVLFVTTITVAVLATAALAAWWLMNSPDEARVTAYAVQNETTLSVKVDTGSAVEFVDAYADESDTTVTVHVLVKAASGPTNGVGLETGERVTLAAPLGDRQVLDAAGHPVTEVKLGRIPTQSLAR